MNLITLIENNPRKNDYKIAYEKHIKPYFGDKKINALKPSDIAMWQNQVLETVSPRRLKMVRAVLLIIQDALRDEIITRNPLPCETPTK